MLLEATIEFHAWATSRPKFESQAAVQRFENTISSVTEIEKEQGMCSRAHSYTLFYRHIVGRPYFAIYLRTLTMVCFTLLTFI